MATSSLAETKRPLIAWTMPPSATRAQLPEFLEGRNAHKPLICKYPLQDSNL